MSKALLVCYRNKKVSPEDMARVRLIEKEVIPDNITPNELSLKSEEKVISCIYNPVFTEQHINNSICLGNCYDKLWWQKSGSESLQEGSYAIFRDFQGNIELQSDAVASRTIWYYMDEEMLVASNSQLAIIYYLQTFEFNESVIPWVLSSGTLGPSLSWDSRIQVIKPQSKLVLNKNTWKSHIEKDEIVFNTENRNGSDTTTYQNQLKELIDRSVLSLPLKDNIILPLSGGYDSRGILLSLNRNEKKIPLLTWGSRKAIRRKGNDASLAKELADYFNFEHEYLLTENAEINAITVIDRFVKNSEGRTDHIGGYMDGFDVWKKLYEKGNTIIIRGDEGFGWRPILADKHAMKTCSINFIKDINNLKGLNYEQTLPLELERRKNETIAQWRDRLYHTYRIPTILAALNETKSGYVEIMNPLLTYSIISFVRTLPDELRTGKKLFKELVNQDSPPIPFANEPANISHKIQLNRPEIINYFISTITNSPAEFIDNSFLDRLIHQKVKESDKNFKKLLFSKIKKHLPTYLKSWVKAEVKNLYTIDKGVLLFRIFIIYKMNNLISETLTKMKNENSHS